MCDIGMAIKYLWRHGSKTEEGIDAKQKAIENLGKCFNITNSFDVINYEQISTDKEIHI